MGIAQYHPVFDGLLVPEFHTAGQLAHLVLRNARHDGQAGLAVLVQRIDVVILKKHRHPVREQLPRVADAVQRVSRKTRNFLCHDIIELPRYGVLDHPVEIFPLLRRNTGNPFIDISVHISPPGIRFDIILIILRLVFQGIELLIPFTADTGVICHPQGNLPYWFVFKLFPYPEYFHIHDLLWRPDFVYVFIIPAQQIQRNKIKLPKFPLPFLIL